MLDDPDDDAQWQATVALGRMGKLAVPSLIEALSSPKERARWKAENAVEKIGTEAVPDLAKALKHERVAIRQSAAYLLGEIKDERGLEDLAAALADKDENVRWKAATSLTKFGPKATPAALKRLEDPSVDARRCAAWVFQQTLDPAAVPSLAKAMSDADEQVRWNAAIALQKIGPASAPPLFGLLRAAETKADLKKMDIWVLEHVEDEQVQKILKGLLKDSQKGTEAVPPGPPAKAPPPTAPPKSVTLALTPSPTMRRPGSTTSTSASRR